MKYILSAYSDFHSRRSISSWCLFDWANSSYSTVIITFVIPAYFVNAVAADSTIATAQWGVMTGFAALIIAFSAPVLGAIVDAGYSRKPWLAVLTIFLVIGAALLWFVRPNPEDSELLLWLVGLTLVFSELGFVFYNGMLPTLAPYKYIGRISGMAWGLGYFGGLTCLTIVLFVFVQAEIAPFGLDKLDAEHIRISGPFVAVWLSIFSLPIFIWTSDEQPRNLPSKAIILSGLKALVNTLVTLPKNSQLSRFLLARMLYTDGINTLFAFGGLYAAGTFGMSIKEVIIFGLLLNMTAGIGAFAFSRIDDWIGSKFTILFSLFFIITFGVPLLIIESTFWFWILGAGLGIFFGPVQSASRSMMVRISKPEKSSQMFGLFAFSGKATAFVGPWLVSFVVLTYGSQRLALATVLPFLIIGAFLMLSVREPAGAIKDSD
tara:strand:+ start:3089 stop:4390 length:1302 start_codon:yes stop_codon:yes gene_type:complete